MEISRYRVIFANGTAEYGDQAVAAAYAAEHGGIRVDTVRYDIPEGDTEAVIAASRKAYALKALALTDSVAIRCVKSGAPFPAEWREYAAGLRAVAGGISVNMPEQPEFPEGT